MDFELNYTPPQWWLEAVIAIDGLSPGVAGPLMRTSHHRRQVSAAVLSHGVAFKPASPNTPYKRPLPLTSPDALLTARLGALISAAYGTCPPAYLTMLDRMGGHIAASSVYRRLHEVYANPAHAAVAKALRGIDRPTDTIIDIAIGCPSWLLETGVLPLLKSVQHRNDLIAVTELIEEACPAADAKTLTASLRAAVKAGDTYRFVYNWLRRADFPKSDLVLDGAFTLVPNAVELARVARLFSNCCETYRLEVLAGVSMFFLCKTPHGEFLSHVQRAALDCPWEYAGTHSPGNHPTPHCAREFAEKSMRDAGVIIPRGYRDVPDRWKPVERLSAPFEDDLETMLFGP
jgi:hypothetical protein